MLMLTTTTTAEVMPEYSVSRLPNEATLTVQAGDFRFEEVLSPTAFALTIESARDRVQMAGDHHGELVVIRGDRKHVLNMAVASDAHRRELRALLADAPALDELARVANAAREADSKYATFLENANALVRTVQGDVRATRDLVVQAMAPTAWCGYEYNIKATLAGYWLLDCNGIP